MKLQHSQSSNVALMKDYESNWTLPSHYQKIKQIEALVSTIGSIEQLNLTDNDAKPLGTRKEIKPFLLDKTTTNETTTTGKRQAHHPIMKTTGQTMETWPITQPLMHQGLGLLEIHPKTQMPWILTGTDTVETLGISLIQLATTANAKDTLPGISLMV